MFVTFCFECVFKGIVHHLLNLMLHHNKFFLRQSESFGTEFYNALKYLKNRDIQAPNKQMEAS